MDKNYKIVFETNHFNKNEAFKKRSEHYDSSYVSSTDGSKKRE